MFCTDQAFILLQGGGALKGLLSSLAVFSFAFTVSYLASSHFTPVHDSSAEGISIISGGAYYANITSSGTIDLNINSTPDGAYNLGKDSLAISTNSTLGYKLYISTSNHSSDSPALPSTTPSNSLINISDGSGGPGDNTKYVSPSTGTVSTPTLLETNTWGYTTSRSTSSQSSTEVTKSNAAPTTTEGGQAIWKAIPVYGSEDLFYNNTTPSTASTNSVDVYYAANVSTALLSGEYSNTVVYTAIVEGTNPSTSTDDITISPVEQQTTNAGTTITIDTGIYSGFDISNLGTAEVLIGSNACTSPSFSKDPTSGNLIIACTSPAQTNAGTYNVTVTLSKNGQVYKTYTKENAYRYISIYNYTTCASASTGSTFTMDGTTYIKLADGNCWIKNSLGGMAWDQANMLTEEGTSSICPVGTHIPSAQEFNNLVSYYDGSLNSGMGSPYGYWAPTGALNTATGWNGYPFWTATEYDSSHAWFIRVGDSNVIISNSYGTYKGEKSATYRTLCVGGTKPEFYTITDMQQMNHSICASVPAPTLSNMTNVITKTNWTASSAGTPQTTLVDTRSGTAMKTYTIRKFADGKCWMAQNLRYAPTTATKLSSGSSDITSALDYTIPALGTANSGPTDYNGDEAIEVGTVDTGYKTPSNDYNYGAYYDATYYSWHTATAGTGTASMTSGFATSSICPRNWRLPTGGNGNGTTAATTAGDATGLAYGDFKQLDIAFGGTGANNQGGGRANWVNNTYGFNAALLGGFNGAGAYNSGSGGAWWSSSVNTGGSAYGLYLYTSVMYPQDGGGKGGSFALRCVAR